MIRKKKKMKKKKLLLIFIAGEGRWLRLKGQGRTGLVRVRVLGPASQPASHCTGESGRKEGRRVGDHSLLSAPTHQ